MTLYRFSLQEHYTELLDLLLRSGPTTASLVGWFLGSNVFELDPIDKLKIWTSHPQPLESNDLVVWIFDGKEGTRLFVSSELVLDKGEFTSEAVELSAMESYEDTPSVAYFVDPQLECLYSKSKEILEPLIKEYKDIKESNVFFHMVNVLWSPVIYKIWNVTPAPPCFKFIKPCSTFKVEKEIELPKDLKFTHLEECDIEKIASLNSIPYGKEYIRDCMRISSAIKRVDNNELAAYAMTHRNFLVASLHVVTEYRRKGYAEIIVDDICKKYKKAFQTALPNEANELYFIATVLKVNTASANLFQKSGWTKFGLGNTWFLASK